MSDTRALEWLLREPGWPQDHDGTPIECSDCPFGNAETRFHDEPNPADPGEGHYNCELLGLTGPEAVWGENPVCKPGDWRARARTELGTVDSPAALREMVAQAVDRSTSEEPTL